MDVTAAVEDLSGGDAAVAARIRSLISENGHFEEVFSEYLAASAVLAEIQRSRQGNDPRVEEYQNLVAERVVELKEVLAAMPPTDDSK